jgi:hypothetical protein
MCLAYMIEIIAVSHKLSPEGINAKLIKKIDCIFSFSDSRSFISVSFSVSTSGLAFFHSSLLPPGYLGG